MQKCWPYQGMKFPCFCQFHFQHDFSMLVNNGVIRCNKIEYHLLIVHSGYRWIMWDHHHHHHYHHHHHHRRQLDSFQPWSSEWHGNPGNSLRMGCQMHWNVLIGSCRFVRIYGSQTLWLCQHSLYWLYWLHWTISGSGGCCGMRISCTHLVWFLREFRAWYRWKILNPRFSKFWLPRFAKSFPFLQVVTTGAVIARHIRHYRHYPLELIHRPH